MKIKTNLQSSCENQRAIMHNLHILIDMSQQNAVKLLNVTIQEVWIKTKE